MERESETHTQRLSSSSDAATSVCTRRPFSLPLPPDQDCNPRSSARLPPRKQLTLTHARTHGSSHTHTQTGKEMHRQESSLCRQVLLSRDCVRDSEGDESTRKGRLSLKCEPRIPILFLALSLHSLTCAPLQLQRSPPPVAAFSCSCLLIPLLLQWKSKRLSLSLSPVLPTLSVHPDFLRAMMPVS